MRIVHLLIILAFDANTKLLDLTEKLKTAIGKYRINMVIFHVCRLP